MGGMKDKRQEPGKGREEQQRPQRSGQDPVHPEPRTPSRGGQRPEETERHREEDRLREERERDDDF
ncbi:hypothetical protein ACFRSX_31140 [Streptomyces goshikiensis]|uniref:hypothetical protein n=1 Tax=Streptomyces TaxID=1883 RepID=UPI001F32C572|nr:hypothetical protein [Streptomyces sp. CB02120-2]